MPYAPIHELTLSRLRESVLVASAIKKHAGTLVQDIAEEFERYRDDLGVNLTASPDALAVEIQSPFGVARGRFSLNFRASGFYGRYSFERKFQGPSDDDRWEQVFFVDIDADSNIECECEFKPAYNLRRPYRDYSYILAFTIAAALGRNPADQIS